MSISKNIKRLREEYNLTQAELGKIAGVSDKAVWTWENGSAEPRMGAVQRIADYFNIRKSEILDEPETIAAHHDGEDWTAEELEEKAFKEAIHAAIQSLSPRDREITRLFMDGLSERTIASKIDCPRKSDWF